MKINVCVVIQGSVVNSLSESNKENYTYEIPENKECEHHYTLDNICRYFRLSLHTKPINKEKNKECEHRTQLMSNPPKCKDCGMVMVVYNEPIINPHMKKERPNKNKAREIIERLFDSENPYTISDVLYCLGFVEGEE